MSFPNRHEGPPSPIVQNDYRPLVTHGRAMGPDLWAAFDVLWRRRALLLVVTLIGAVGACVLALMLPRAYRAEATVFLTPPTYSTTLRSEVMSVEAYARLAETEHILAKVTAELRKLHPGLFGSVSEERAGVTFAARLSASREPQKPYLPLIALTATSDKPEKAKLAANLWADVFIREEGLFAQVGKVNAASFILKEYPKVEQTVGDSENELQTLRAKQGQELAALKTRLALSLRTAQLKAYEMRVLELEEALASAQTERDALRPAVEQTEKELKATPQHLTVTKAITDDALWNAQAQKATGRDDALQQSKLQSQEINPVHLALSQRLARARVDYNAVGPRIASLRQQLATARRAAADMQRAVLDGERQTGEMERRHEVEGAGVRRSLETAKKSYEKLADKIGEARLAQSELDKDIKLGAYAELPTKPSGAGRAMIVAGATAGVFTLTALILLAVGLVTTHQRAAETPSVARLP